MSDFSCTPQMCWDSLEKISSELGDAFYVLDDKAFEYNFQQLLGAFRELYPNTNIGYSYKTNYIPLLCRRVLDLGGYAEVVSEMEYDAARRIGVPGNKIIFNGPYKSKSAFEAAIKEGAIVNLDNERDFKMLLKFAVQNQDQTFEVALRCNFEVAAGSVSRFGFDIDSALFKGVVDTITSIDNVEIVGLHCHFPDRDKLSYSVRVKMMLALSDKMFGQDLPKFINIGGGFFGDIPKKLKRAFSIDHVTFSEYAHVVANAFSQHFGAAPDSPELIIEPGTAIVANTMKFYARVLDVKTIRGHNFASIAGSIFNISPVARNLNLPVRVITNKTEEVLQSYKFDVVGYTCIEGDVMSKELYGAIYSGDFVEYSNIGSYSIVMKPPFILPNFPIIRFNGASDPGSWCLVKKAETVDYIFENFIDKCNGQTS